MLLAAAVAVAVPGLARLGERLGQRRNGARSEKGEREREVQEDLGVDRGEEGRLPEIRVGHVKEHDAD